MKRALVFVAAAALFGGCAGSSEIRGTARCIREVHVACGIDIDGVRAETHEQRECARHVLPACWR